jgi:hypothetical protein
MSDVQLGTAQACKSASYQEGKWCEYRLAWHCNVQVELHCGHLAHMAQWEESQAQSDQGAQHDKLHNERNDERFGTAPSQLERCAGWRAQERWETVLGGSDCFSFSALSPSGTARVYKYLEHRTLNFVDSFVFLIFTETASFRLAVRRNSLMSLISLGCTMLNHQNKEVPKQNQILTQ